jgi:hypothetical protein
MAGHISEDQIKKIIIIFAESGLLAGDLAAWLSAKFFVKRVTTEARLHQALLDPVAALIIVQENTPQPSEECLQVLKSVIQEPRSPAFRILLVGIDPALLPPFWRGLVTCLPAVPGPQDILTALKISPREAEA